MAATEVFNFKNLQTSFSAAVKLTIKQQDFQIIRKDYEKYKISDADKKMAMDFALRDSMKELLFEKTNSETLTSLLNLCVECVSLDLCTTPTPFIVLSDVFDTLRLKDCEEIFLFVESKVGTWKMAPFFSAGRNYLLRMCNDLLRRLSRSQNTVFCGRIQLFLARLFPLDERSGLNLTGLFNLENLTKFTTNSEQYNKSREQMELTEKERHENMDVEEGEMENDEHLTIPVDYNLYNKFWSLQDFFRRPNSCLDKIQWNKFLDYAKTTLSCFESYKLDDTKTSKRQEEAFQSYFAKYLTSEKLLDLQLSDGTFRRYVLVQFLVLFQYLTADVKFKSKDTLMDSQMNSIRDNTKKVYQLLRETPPDGEAFASTIKHLIEREHLWNEWKNGNCQSFSTAFDESNIKIRQQRIRKRSVGEDMKVNKRMKMGNAELTRLWNLQPDNMAACVSSERNFNPTLLEFFEEAIEQADPENQIDREYHHVTKPTFQWRALRLLGQNSGTLFPSSNPQKIQPLDVFLEETAKNVVKKTQPVVSEEVKTEVIEEVESLKDDHVGDLGDDKGGENSGDIELSRELILAIAHDLGSEWKQLAVELGVSDAEIAEEGEEKEAFEYAEEMILKWMENEDDKATASALESELRELGMTVIADKHFPPKNDT
ncbi:DgyrCDS10089 [Dimorphilus gyrociliatus]|uniref:DgyrCDS10089 n=1 Tax=Dimorphilus gyrociliatus TaxID=2664684 RepID=A0A7I8W491_9ANNE|nr:DgyrCDS10089 [Dimorphilus gyrociliatus]